jgi:hypothetical protein
MAGRRGEIGLALGIERHGSRRRKLGPRYRVFAVMNRLNALDFQGSRYQAAAILNRSVRSGHHAAMACNGRFRVVSP